MNLSFVLFLSLLLFGSCLSANVDRVGASKEEFRLPNNITEFFEKYQGRIFNLQIQNSSEVIVFPDSVYIPDYNFYLDLITQFGDRIGRIGIVRSSQINENNWAVLFQRINEHCADSLTYLAFEYIREYTFENITKSFTKMEQLFFGIKTNEVGSNLPLDVLFPNLKFLRIDYFRPAGDAISNETRFIEIELPAMANLKEISAYSDVKNLSDAATIERQLGNMFQRNPQIQQLWYGPNTNDFIHEIRKHLINLQNLSLHLINADIHPVHFDSVKTFELTSWGTPSAVEKISFSNLDTLNMVYDPRIYGGNITDSWKAFFKNHQNLKKLDCRTTREVGFVKFVAELSNLHEIRINSFETFNINLVSDLIEGNNNWSKLHYEANPIAYPDNYPDMNAFDEKFGNTWDITYNFKCRPFVNLGRKN